MPSNAANRQTLPLASSQPKRFWIGEHKSGATGEVFNESYTAALNVTFENANVLMRRDFVWSAAPASGTFKFTFNGLETAAIAWNATGPTVKAAIAALRTATRLRIEVTAITNGYRVVFFPRDGSGMSPAQGPIHAMIPFDPAVTTQVLTLSTNAVLDGGSAATTVTETDRTWTLVLPDSAVVTGGNDEVTQLTFAATPAGNFTITVAGLTTANIVYSGTAGTLESRIQAALDTLLGTGVAKVKAQIGTVALIAWGGFLAHRDLTVTATNPDTTGTTTVLEAFKGAGSPATVSFNVKQRAKEQFSFGNSNGNTIGPFFRISSDGVGLMEFSISDETINVVRI